MNPRTPVFDGYVYDRHGTRLGVVKEVSVHTQMLDVTCHGDSSAQFVEGIRTTTMVSVSLGSIAWQNPQAWTCSYCRGMQPTALDGRMVTNCSNCGGARQH